MPLPPLPLPPLLLLPPAPVSPPLPASLTPVPVSMAMPVSMVPVSPPLPSLPPPSLTRTSPLASPLGSLLASPPPLFLTRPHVVVHWPKRQTRGGEHFLPQVPQLFGSDVTSVHTWSLPQNVLVGQIGAPSL